MFGLPKKKLDERLVKGLNEVFESRDIRIKNLEIEVKQLREVIDDLTNATPNHSRFSMFRPLNFHRLAVILEQVVAHLGLEAVPPDQTGWRIRKVEKK